MRHDPLKKTIDAAQEELERREAAERQEATRREFLERLGKGAAGLAIGAAGLSLLSGRAWSGATPTPPKVAAADKATTSAAAAAASSGAPGASGAAGAAAADLSFIQGGETPSALCRAAVDAIGGMKRFVKKGAVVVVKPNIGWDRTPELAANTNPEVVAELVKMAFEAGAAKVKVFDRPCQNMRSCYTHSGIEEAARAAGATVLPFDEARCRNMTVSNGVFLKEWPVIIDAVEADCYISVPVAKVHGGSKVTLGIKNQMGIVGGNRGHWHQDLETSIADSLGMVKPHLTVIDAWRILHSHGPTGGSPDYVRMMKTCIASADPVAAEAGAAPMLGFKPEDLDYLRQSAARGYGQIDISKVRMVRKG